MSGLTSDINEALKVKDALFLWVMGLFGLVGILWILFSATIARLDALDEACGVEQVEVER